MQITWIVRTSAALLLAISGPADTPTLSAQRVSAADPDLDGDGIPNRRDRRPYVADLPDVTFAIEAPRLGIEYRVSGTTEKTSRESQEITHTRTHDVGVKKVVELTRTQREELAAKLTPVPPFVSVTDTYWKGSDERQSISTTTFSDEEWLKVVDQRSQFREVLAKTKIEFSDRDGYIKTAIRIRNNSAGAVTIKNLNLAVVGVDPFVPDNVSVFASFDVSKGGLSTISLPASAAAGQTDTLEVKLPPNTAQDHAVYVKGLSSSDVVSYLSEPRLVAVRVNSYDLAVDGDEAKLASLRSSVEAKCIELNVARLQGGVETLYVSARDEKGLARTARSALLAAFGKGVAFGNRDRQTVVERVRGQSGDSSSWVLTTAEDVAGDAFNTPLEPESIIGLVEVPSRVAATSFQPLGSAELTVFPDPLSGAPCDASALQLRQGCYAPVCVGNIRPYQTVQLEFTAQERDYSVSTRVPTDANIPRNSQYFDAIIKGYDVKETVRTPGQFRRLRATTPGQLPLLIVGLDGVRHRLHHMVPAGPVPFSSTPQAVQTITFHVPGFVLPADGGRLCFDVEWARSSATLGRQWTIPPIYRGMVVPTGVQEDAARQLIAFENWRTAFPLSERNVDVERRIVLHRVLVQ